MMRLESALTAAEELRLAADLIRHDLAFGQEYGKPEFLAAVASLLDGIASGDTDREADWSNPADIRAALAVARAYANTT